MQLPLATSNVGPMLLVPERGSFHPTSVRSVRRCGRPRMRKILTSMPFPPMKPSILGSSASGKTLLGSPARFTFGSMRVSGKNSRTSLTPSGKLRSSKPTRSGLRPSRSRRLHPAHLAYLTPQHPRRCLQLRHRTWLPPPTTSQIRRVFVDFWAPRLHYRPL